MAGVQQGASRIAGAGEEGEVKWKRNFRSSLATKLPLASIVRATSTALTGVRVAMHPVVDSSDRIASDAVTPLSTTLRCGNVFTHLIEAWLIVNAIVLCLALRR